MDTRGVFNREGEALGYLIGERLYDMQDNQTGRIDGQVVYDMDGERRWLIEGDAVMDLRGNVIGYLGQPNLNYT